jgi:hypothetical protein
MSPLANGALCLSTIQHCMSVLMNCKLLIIKLLKTFEFYFQFYFLFYFHLQLFICKSCKKDFGRKMANRALCLSTPKHNGKSGTADMAGLLDIFILDIYSS